MSIVILRLIVDFGLLVLIWIIQLIVYPSFRFYKTENLVTWHKKYTSLIGSIVAPLMLFQLGIALQQIIYATNLINLINIIIIAILWLSTFLQFIPLHNKISKGQVSREILNSIVNKNWLRTSLWTTLFVLNLIVFWKV